ncbi:MULTISPECIES: hypothetical protein [Bradyrhizobium]|uniref:hypothetical protein n=1 Tax=Bradyrhizobium TaxID=374 RepID=UPI000487A96B|nr:hypothetical protein [Bradyrhizobium japonicum]KMJ95005.1 hypothetical protein CF64_33875 [Bradyrhizobium japonicum]MCS3537029.1 hypothetical protein [Bradyrhizobium japonicum]MCS3986914.1 hypothetical protein [Bradyrhizobium japonicum]MCS4018270.1 hypothetical protein [Bradyrhizobium japonicum]MCS4205407.1 hypothetical protein [Bradyrhizobium japonicum]
MDSETLRVFGFINREHKVKISTPQGSSDVQLFQRRRSGVIYFSASAKRYQPVIEIASGIEPVQLRRRGDRQGAAFVETVGRQVDVDGLQVILGLGHEEQAVLFKGDKRFLLGPRDLVIHADLERWEPLRDAECFRQHSCSASSGAYSEASPSSSAKKRAGSSHFPSQPAKVLLSKRHFAQCRPAHPVAVRIEIHFAPH